MKATERRRRRDEGYNDRRGPGEEHPPGSRGIDVRSVEVPEEADAPQFLKLMAEQPPAVVVMEACESAHHWARVMAAFGHEVRLIPAQYLKPFVKRQKNDAADPEAIVVAAQRREMRFVKPESEQQQARSMMFRGRERLVHQRTSW